MCAGLFCGMRIFFATLNNIDPPEISLHDWMLSIIIMIGKWLENIPLYTLL